MFGYGLIQFLVVLGNFGNFLDYGGTSVFTDFVIVLFLIVWVWVCWFWYLDIAL